MVINEENLESIHVDLYYYEIVIKRASRNDIME